MLCVKCGEEYEGASCPRCEGPQILVNNDDYLRRKKAYEEKQAAKGSASSDNKDVAEGDKKTDSKKVQKKVKLPAIDVRSLARKCARPMALLLIGVVAVVAVVAVFSGRKQKAYVRSEGNIYALKGESLEQVCSDDNAFFTADGTCFYEVSIPDEYSDKYIAEKQASPKGKCFVVALYNENSKKYCVALLKDNQTYIVAESDMRLDVMYVSDTGVVVYTALDVVNDEGYTGRYELFVYEASNKKKPLEGGKIKQLTENLSYADVLAASEVLLFVDKDNNLSVYNYGVNSNVECVAENVTSVYVPDNDATGKYISHTGYVCMDERATGIIYKEGNKCYYADLKQKSDERTYVGSINGGVNTIVYKNSEYMYYVDGDKLMVTVVNRVLNEFGNGYSTVLDTKELAVLNGSSNVLWIEDSSTLLYVNSNNELCKAQKDVITIIATDVLPNTLVSVEGTKQGIIYARSEGWYYVSDMQAKAVKLGLVSDAYIKKVVTYNGKLHMVLNDNKLFTSTVKGDKLKEIGLAEYIWLAKD